MEEFTVYGIALVPIIMGMVELIKRSGLPKKYSPVAALVLGILAGFYYLAPGEPHKAVLFGLAMGLTSVGLYSGTKNTMEGLRGSNKITAYGAKSVKAGKNKLKNRWKKTG